MSAFPGACDASSATPGPAPEAATGYGHTSTMTQFTRGTAPAGEAWDAMDNYFECITTCSLEDGECITRCVEELREHA